MAEPANSTANQGLPYPDELQLPADIPLYIQRLAEATEKKLVQVHASISDRSTKIPAPTEGMFSWLQDANTLSVYNGSAWIQIYPSTAPAILSGTSNPTSGQGANGDVFLKYV